MPIYIKKGNKSGWATEGYEALFDEELARLIGELGRGKDAGDERTLRRARELSEEMIRNSWFDPV